MPTPPDECINHPCFPQPNNQSLKVWRYTSLSKFLSLISTSKLYLSRLDQLNDPHEGSFPKSMVELRNSEIGVRGHPDLWGRLNFEARREIFVSCWTLQQSESEALWRLYAGNIEGVAIQISYSKLINIAKSENFVYIGCVKYIDYDSEAFDSPEWPKMWNGFQPVMHKRLAFAHEHEVRLVKWIHDTEQNSMSPMGHEIAINLEELIENIFISPYAQDWYTKAVEAVIERFQPNLVPRIKWSKMRAQPLY